MLRQWCFMFPRELSGQKGSLKNVGKVQKKGLQTGGKKKKIIVIQIGWGLSQIERKRGFVGKYRQWWLSSGNAVELRGEGWGPIV